MIDDRAKSGRGLRRRSADRIGARRRWPVCALLRRRHIQYRGLSRPAPGSTWPSPRRSATIPIPTASWRLAAAEGVSANLILARARPASRLWPHRKRPGRRTALRAIGATSAPARELFELPDWMRVAEGLMAARLIYFSGITLSLYSNAGLGRFLAVLEARAPAGRQGGVRRQFPSARLERRSRAHPHRVHRGAQARRHRAADLRRRSGACGAIPRRRRPSRGCKPSASARSWSRTDLTARWSRSAGAQEFVPVPEVVVPVDTTAAGRRL